MKTLLSLCLMIVLLNGCKKTPIEADFSQKDQPKIEITPTTAINCDYWTFDENGNSVFIACDPQGGGGGNSNPYGFCESGCVDEVWIINEGAEYNGPGSFANYNKFHFHINNPKPYDIKIEFLNLVAGLSSVGSWGNEVIIPAGQTNSQTLTNQQELDNLCTGTNTGAVSKTWIISITAVNELFSNTSLNSTFQLKQNMTGVSISGLCYTFSGLGDIDGDGVADNIDDCPGLPGTSANHGCPSNISSDSDGDGILNAYDACPLVPGLTSNHGCP